MSGVLPEAKLLRVLRTMPRSTAEQIHTALAEEGVHLAKASLRGRLRDLHERGVIGRNDRNASRGRIGQPHYTWWVK